MNPAAISLLACPVLLAVLLSGLAWPLLARRTLAPADKIVATAALSLLGVYLFSGFVYVARLPLSVHGLLPVLAVGGMAARWSEFRATWRDSAVREIGLGQAMVTGWCTGLLALVVTYSGGGWTGDWFEHWERVRFFLERGPPDTQFLGYATLTARPPLANLVTAANLALTRADFAHYQLVSTLLASLAFAPAALLARRFGGTRAIPRLALLFMVNPLFVQNATFAWTKLPAAFFLLAALVFLLHAWENERPILPALLFSACLGAAILTHYSAGPVALVFAAAWLARSRTRRSEPAWWTATATAAALGIVILVTWFGWALATYGLARTLLSNTSVQTAEASFIGQIWRVVLNLRDTLVPHFLRPIDSTLIAQASPWGWWRDWWFQACQVNLPLAAGSVAWLGIGAAVLPAWRSTGRSRRTGWLAAVVVTVLVGVAVHGARDTWGLTHICLQPVVLLGIAFLAGRWETLPRPWQAALAAGAAFDLLAGITFHFAVQNLVFERWVGPAAFGGWQTNNSESAVMNMAAKLHHHLQFFSDAVPLPPVVIAAALLALLFCASARAAWRHANPTAAR